MIEGLASLTTVLFLAVAWAAFTAWLVHRCWKKKNTFSRTTKVTALGVAVASALGAMGTLVGLVRIFGAVGGESSDPSQKARILAEGISEATNCAALGFVLWLPGTIALLVLTRRRTGVAK